MENIFRDKEVLLKVITFIDNSSYEGRLQLIDEISNATNKQTPVINADRFANEIFHQKIQKKVFEKYGLLYERKRGEFSDGLKNRYIDIGIVIERNLFLRLFYSANGKIERGVQKRLFQRNDFPDLDLNDEMAFDRFFVAFHVFRQLSKNLKPNQPIGKNIYAKVYAYNQLFFFNGVIVDVDVISHNIVELESAWKDFMNEQKNTRAVKKRAYIDRETGEAKVSFREGDYFRGRGFEGAVASFFGHPLGARPVLDVYVNPDRPNET